MASSLAYKYLIKRYFQINIDNSTGENTMATFPSPMPLMDSDQPAFTVCHDDRVDSEDKMVDKVQDDLAVDLANSMNEGNIEDQRETLDRDEIDSNATEESQKDALLSHFRVNESQDVTMHQENEVSADIACDYDNVMDTTLVDELEAHQPPNTEPSDETRSFQSPLADTKQLNASKDYESSSAFHLNASYPIFGDILLSQPFSFDIEGSPSQSSPTGSPSNGQENVTAANICKNDEPLQEETISMDAKNGPEEDVELAYEHIYPATSSPGHDSSSGKIDDVLIVV